MVIIIYINIITINYKSPWWLRRVKHLLAMWEIQVRSLGWEDSLKKEMATHSSTLAWKIPWMEKPSRLLCMGL